MTGYLLKGIGISLALTLVLESFYAFVLGIRGKRLLPVLLVNFLTNPPVVLLALTVVPGIGGRAVIELAVMAVEGFVYYCFGKTKDFVIEKPFLKAILLNAFSYGVGGIITHLSRFMSIRY